MKYLLDCSNMACPQPVVKTKNAIESGKFDELEIIVDNNAAKENVKRFVENFGHKILKVEEKSKKFHLFAKINSNNKNDSTFTTISCTNSDTNNKVIFIGTNNLGVGSEVLGEKLMQSFIYSLTEMDNSPSKIIFMNSGVKLTIEDATTLKSLTILQNKGSEILVCGTCLDFYNITNSIAVGKISNMYDITEILINLTNNIVSIT